MTRWVRAAVEIDGPFFADTEKEVLASAYFGEMKPEGPNWTWEIDGRMAWTAQSGFRTTGRRDGEIGEPKVKLGDIDGVPVHCTSPTCKRRVLENRPNQAPPMVAKVVAAWAEDDMPEFIVVRPSSRYRESKRRRSGSFRVSQLPAGIHCVRCGATGQVRAATLLTVLTEPT